MSHSSNADTSNRNDSDWESTDSNFSSTISFRESEDMLISCDSYPVYITFSERHLQNVALKIYQHHNQRPDPAFTNESRLKDLDHKNVIKCLEIGFVVNHQREEIDKRSYIMMEEAICDYALLASKFIFAADEILLRTIFHQLIRAIEYLHSQGYSHLNISLENVLLGRDLNLKLSDFKNSTHISEGKVLFNMLGATVAPEMRTSLKLEDPRAADIYSAGKILMIMSTPNLGISEENFDDLITNDLRTFKDLREARMKSSNTYNNEINQLIDGMIQEQPEKRLTLDNVLNNSWFNGPVYCEDDLVIIYEEILAEIS